MPRLQRVSSNWVAHLEQTASWHGIVLSRKQIQAMRVPNTVVSLSAFAWMASYFDAVGEKQPNCGEIHLDPCTATHIWEEYKYVLSDAGEVSKNV